MIPKDTLQYILDFLAGENYSKYVGYTDNTSEYGNYKIVIRPSSFFAQDVFLTVASEPQAPFDSIDGVPILFGSNAAEKIGDTLVVGADFVASTFFLISRYEELINKNRDQHGRFCGRDSVLGRLNCIHRPLADEYARLLRNMLRQQGVGIEESEGYNRIYLTHDADKLTQYRNLRGFGGGCLRALKKNSPDRFMTVLKSAFGKADNDPLFTFQWLFDLDNTVADAMKIVFVKANNSPLNFDKPTYKMQSADVQRLFALCAKNNAEVGLHASYFSGENPDEILNEKQRLENAAETKICHNRYHFLRSCSPSDMLRLSEAGITDDFTMGFADVAGFRLGTCRAVRFIDPQRKVLTNITLHPLAIMDCTLDDARYMRLSFDEAYEYCKAIFEQIRRHCGEVVLLWHNTSVSVLSNSYHKELYARLLKLLTR